MKIDKRTLGLISLAVIIGGISLFSYINNGKDNLKGDESYEEMFVDEGNESSSTDEEKSKSSNNTKENVNTNNKEDNKEVLLKDKTIAVDIKGEVINQGVYYLEEGCIVEDLIIKAGGVTKNASLEFVNRAEKLENNKCVVIPSKEEVKKMKEGNTTITEENKWNTENNKNISEANSNSLNKTNSENKNSKININTASIDELDNINGIGPSKAKAIIDYREENGSFKSIDEIKNVSGIGDGTFLKIKESITV